MWIEEIKYSIISHKVRFVSKLYSASELMKTRRKHIECTQMMWITLEPIVSKHDDLYNQKASILTYLN